MAPTFVHGRGTRVLVNTRDLSEILNDSEASGTVEMHDVTCYVSSTGGTATEKAYKPGLKDGTVTLTGLADGSTARVDAILSAALAASTKTRVTYGPGSAAVGDPAILVNTDATDFTVTSPVSDMVAVTASLQASQLRYGHWLASPTAASTSTGGLATVNSYSTTAGASTRGGVAHCHIVSATTSTGVVKVQHSTDGASWADLLTFTISSGRSVQRSTVAGSVKEKVRANVHQASTAGFTVGVAFARHP